MKKNNTLYFILSVAGFLIITLGFKLQVNATYLPPVTPQTSIIPDFLMTVAEYKIINDTQLYSPFKPNYDKVNQIANGRSVADSMVEYYVDNDVNADFTVFYDENGNVIPQSNTFTAFGYSDLGNYSYVADKETGKILAIQDGNHYVSTLQSGDISADFPDFVKSGLLELGAPATPQYRNVLNIIDSAKQNNNVLCDDSLTDAQKEFMGDYEYHIVIKTNNGWSCFVPNACTLNTVGMPSDGRYQYSGLLPANNSVIGTPTFYTKDLSEVSFVGSGMYGYMTRQNNTVYGTTFSYITGWTNIYNPLYNGGYLDFKVPTQAQYNNFKALSEKVVYLQPVTQQGDTVNNYYNYSYVTENPSNPSKTYNNNYDYSQPITNYNYPVTNNISYPNYETRNQYLTEIYNYYNTPNTGGDIGTLPEDNLPTDIPILSNLQKRFPFSIPWDIKAIFEGLSVERETPSINEDVVIPLPNGDFTWHIEYDLHEWDGIATLFRTLFLLSFIIGLAWFSYDHFFGS